MNLPNKLTLLRVILVPFYVFFMLTDIVPFSPVIALAIFAAASPPQTRWTDTSPAAVIL